MAVAGKSSLPPGPLVSVRTPPEPMVWDGSWLYRWPLGPTRTPSFLKLGARGLELQSLERGQNQTREGGSVSPGHLLGVLPVGGVRLVQPVEGMAAAHFWSFPRRGLLEQISQPVVFPQGLPALLYDLYFIVEEETSKRASPLPHRTERKSSRIRHFDLNLCFSSLPGVEIRRQVAGRGRGSVFTRAAAPDPWPTRPSSACVLTLPGDPGCRRPQGAPALEPLLMDKQLPSRPASGRDQAATLNGQHWPIWTRLAQAKRQALSGESWARGTKLPQSRPEVTHKAGQCSPTEREEPPRPVPTSRRAGSPAKL